MGTKTRVGSIESKLSLFLLALTGNSDNGFMYRPNLVGEAYWINRKTCPSWHCHLHLCTIPDS